MRSNWFSEPLLSRSSWRRACRWLYLVYAFSSLRPVPTTIWILWFSWQSNLTRSIHLLYADCDLTYSSAGWSLCASEDSFAVEKWIWTVLIAFALKNFPSIRHVFKCHKIIHFWRLSAVGFVQFYLYSGSYWYKNFVSIYRQYIGLLW